VPAHALLQTPFPLPQRLGPWLSAADTASARLACRAWRDCLGAQVAAAALPPALWQHAGRGQLSQLRRLAAAFPLVRVLHCGYDRGAAIDARCMRRTLGFLARTTPTLAALRLRGMTDAPNWPALADGLSPLAPQLTSLELTDACWPDAGSMAALGSGLTSLRRLRLHSAVFSRLTARHVEVISGLWRLRELSLAFRTVDGMASAPLKLDPLTRLSKLVSLDLEYTGARGRGAGQRAGRAGAGVGRGPPAGGPEAVALNPTSSPINNPCQACWSCRRASAFAAPTAWRR
jgi:hypothetical protein